MITEEAYTPFTFDAVIDGKKAYETRGKWEVKGDFMAGPFLNYKKFDKNIDKSVYGFLDLKNSINNKKSYGGTAISEIRKMISQARKELSNEKY